MLYPQYGGVPGCASCYSPTMILQISNDRGNTWSSPAIMYPDGQTTGQCDAQIIVDQVDGQTVYASWLQNGKSDIVVGKSTDFGATWTVVTADQTNAGTDKPILAARGQNIYVSYNHTQTAYVTVSHDGGATFTEVKINKNAKLGWSLGGGGTVTPNGNVFFSWAGYGNGRIAWMDARTATNGWQDRWNVYYRTSTNGRSTWSPEVDLSTYVRGLTYIFTDGFRYPFGDYFEIDIDEQGTSHRIFGEGYNYDSPGSIWYVKGQ